MGPLNKKKTDSFREQVKKKAQRKKGTLDNNKKSIWLGLGMMGIVGWSVVVPTVLGTALGIWLDKKYSQSFSWTLTFLIVGLFVGCMIAWHWVIKEDKEMHEKKKENEK